MTSLIEARTRESVCRSIIEIIAPSGSVVVTDRLGHARRMRPGLSSDKISYSIAYRRQPQILRRASLDEPTARLVVGLIVEKMN